MISFNPIIVQLRINFNTKHDYYTIQVNTKIVLRVVIAMDVNNRIQALLKERNWTEYKLAKESGLAQSTIANLFRRNTTPSISTLELVCKGFGISLSQFFSEGNMVELSKEQMEFFSNWISLTAHEKAIISDLVKALKNKEIPQRRN